MTCVAISSDGKSFACGSQDCSIKIFDLETGKVCTMKQARCHNGRVMMGFGHLLNRNMCIIIIIIIIIIFISRG